MAGIDGIARAHAAFEGLMPSIDDALLNASGEMSTLLASATPGRSTDLYDSPGVLLDATAVRTNAPAARDALDAANRLLDELTVHVQDADIVGVPQAIASARASIGLIDKHVVTLWTKAVAASTEDVVKSYAGSSFGGAMPLSNRAGWNLAGRKHVYDVDAARTKVNATIVEARNAVHRAADMVTTQAEIARRPAYGRIADDAIARVRAAIESGEALAVEAPAARQAIEAAPPVQV